MTVSAASGAELVCAELPRHAPTVVFLKKAKEYSNLYPLTAIVHIVALSIPEDRCTDEEMSVMSNARPYFIVLAVRIKQRTLAYLTADGIGGRINEVLQDRRRDSHGSRGYRLSLIAFRSMASVCAT